MCIRDRVLFLGQYGILVAYPLLGGDGNYLQHLMTALALFVAIVCGFIGGFSFDKVGDEFVKGLQGLVFVGFVIGLAKVMSLVLAEGMVIHTMVYAMTRPLMGLSRAVSSIGMTAIISVVNLLIPSATSKAAILVPVSYTHLDVGRVLGGGAGDLYPDSEEAQRILQTGCGGE